LSALTYSGVQGNIRARLARLLDGAAWTRLLEAATAAEVVATIEREHGVEARLPALQGRIAASTQALVRFLPGSSRKVVAWYNRRFEIENLKAVLRAVHYQVDVGRARAALIPIEGGGVRWEGLLDAGLVGAVIERLRGTPYGRPLENAMERYQQEQRLFPLEIALDLFYFQKLVRLMESLSRKEAAGARRFLGRSIAIQNLLWAYRYRIYGRMTPEQIINYTLHHAFEAGLDTVRRIALGAPLAVEAGRFGFEVPSGLSEVEALVEIEILAGRELWRRAREAMCRPLFDLGGVLAYLWLLDADVRDLMIVAEGKTMGLSGPEIARRMVRAA
jgi:V/A-type H+/Na+-transporting ATPase subunit C